MVILRQLFVFHYTDNTTCDNYCRCCCNDKNMCILSDDKIIYDTNLITSKCLQYFDNLKDFTTIILLIS